ncbi:hypothetical protein LIER_10928 [Lithospermum erythrorhizon]|uniref:Uncharacterized protein n=1 Tax=Lithospermum erythrorhizon TaxID=34254 RepID=A0AAV3PNG1_LITER
MITCQVLKEMLQESLLTSFLLLQSLQLTLEFAGSGRGIEEPLPGDQRTASKRGGGEVKRNTEEAKEWVKKDIPYLLEQRRRKSVLHGWEPRDNAEGGVLSDLLKDCDGRGLTRGDPILVLGGREPLGGDTDNPTVGYSRTRRGTEEGSEELPCQHHLGPPGLKQRWQSVVHWYPRGHHPGLGWL